MEKLVVKEIPIVNRVKVSGWQEILMVLPYIAAFLIFIVLPIVVAVALSFTDFNAISFPKFIGLDNYIALFTQDSIFMQYVISNTIFFAFIAGPTGFFLSFFMAWILAQIPKRPRTVLALLLYSPSLTAGATMQVIWKVLFSGDASGYLNSYLLEWGVITQPIQWLQSPEYLMGIMILVTVWGSMGVGFLAMLSGVLNINAELYEAAYIDGVKNRFQEIFYVTMPAMKPQMLFGAVMAVVTTFSAGRIGVELSGTNPTPRYSGQLIVSHLEDYGLQRYEMGYSAAIAVVLLVIIYASSKLIFKLLAEKKGGVRK